MFDFVYVHHLSPFLFQTQLWGQTVGVRWYGLAYVLGLCAAFFAFRNAAQRGFLRGLNSEAQGQMIFALAAGVIGGGRLGYVLQHPARWLSDPLYFFRIWESGMAFFGGLVGVILALAWTARRFGLSFWTLADVAAFPAAFGLGVGRIANFVNSELVGRPTGGDWGVIFPRVDALPRHPSQLYEAASHFLLLGVLLWLLRRRPQTAQQCPGVFAALFLALYGALRFLTDFYRADDTYFGPFSSGQWASLIVAVIGLWLLWRPVWARKTQSRHEAQRKFFHAQ
jgi:phosphatidylglycerol:prolipoprotein diacylglycerol transferase